MNGMALEAVLKRDRIIVAAGLAALTILAWAYVVKLAAGMSMGGMDMTGFRMISTGLGMAMQPADAPWTVAEFVLIFLMWAVMMVAMMTPSAAPMILIYARVGRSAAAAAHPLAATGWFVGGYLAVWCGFSLLATIAQWVLQRYALMGPMMASTSSLLGGLVLVVAGAYQWTPLKYACLSGCQSPLAFIQREGGFRRSSGGAFRLGIKHGAYCVGCCWALMALLFVGGIMNLLWIAGLAALALFEKVVPGRLLPRIAGAAMIVAGVRLLLSG